jgi:Cu(I)/Ag(I) efflux system membrane fusion protein
MDLIPLNQNSISEMDPMAVHLTKEAIQLANVMTSIVSNQKPVKEVRLYGKVQADERLLQSQVAHISGRVEKLFVDFTGETVQKGQKLALIYSPELLTAQQELIEAARTKQSQPEIYEASKERLRQWKLTEGQISIIENSGNILSNMEILSNTSGIVTARLVSNGDYVSQGSVLYEVSDLSKVWVLFDAYESDLQFLKTGDNLEFTVQSLPGITFSSPIIFIDPVIDPVNRVAKVRVEINNPNGKLKPEMFATGIVESNLDGYADKMVIPRSAVLWTGKRSVVYVKQPEIEEPVFKIREIELGPMLGDSYIIMEGLTGGEEIVTQGAFSVDASAQLEGKPSMMNPGEEKSSSMSGVELPSLISSAINHLSIGVSGNCEMCKDRIETAAKSVNGVSGANWDIKTKILQLDFDSKTNIENVHQAITKAGHDTEKMKADNKTYNSLPECCLYRK